MQIKARGTRAVALVVAGALAFAACGDDGDQTGGDASGARANSEEAVDRVDPPSTALRACS